MDAIRKEEELYIKSKPLKIAKEFVPRRMKKTYSTPHSPLFSENALVPKESANSLSLLAKKQTSFINPAKPSSTIFVPSIHSLSSSVVARAPPQPRSPIAVPSYVFQIARKYQIPMKSISLAPVINTTKGVMLFDQYVQQIKTIKMEKTEKKEETKAAPQQNTKIDQKQSYIDTTVTKVIMVHNLIANEVSPYDLFKLFGSFGDVHRVKIMFNSRNTAFIQMSSITDVQNLLRHLQGVEFMGQKLALVKSRIPSINLPYHAEASEGLTQDFTFSEEHRFGDIRAKNRRYICKPSNVVHIANLPRNFSKFDCEEEFSSFSAIDNSIKVIMNKGKPGQAFVVLKDISNSLQFLIQYHHTQVERKIIRVSFTATNPEV